ncbi:MAG: type IV pilus secretin PilQ [Pseudomonadales bacterium]|nr:type IV pilus secretin PilQ [Pseudomonadales bacterium]
MFIRILTRLIVSLAALLPVSLYASTKIQDIEFASLPGDKIEIRMEFDDRPPAPTGYTIEQPARISLDLMDVTSGLSSKYHSLGSGNARSVTVVEAGDRTRVIVSMTELVPYSTRVEGNSLYVLVGELDNVDFTVGSNTEVDSISSGVIAPVAADVVRIDEIDFRRGEDGEGRVIVKISDPGVGVDVSSEGGKIRVEFSGTQIPESLQRRLDVTDFATPVLTVDALPEADNTVLLIEPTGDYDYLAYQADNIFTVEVKPLTSAELEAALDQAFRYRGEKLSLNFQDIEVRSVLQLIADFTDLNLVASDTVAGRITLRLKNVPWDQALDIIMKTKGQTGNVLMVAPAEELNAREKLELESLQQISELAPLRTEFIEVRYAKAGDIYELFKSRSSGDGEGGAGGVSAGGVLSNRGSVIVDERTNSIILTETVDKINEFRSVLEKLDVPVRQVLIEARIVTASTNFSEGMGVRWGGGGYGIYDNDSKLTSVGGSVEGIRNMRTALADGTNSWEDQLMVDLGLGAGAPTLAFGVLSSKYLLDLELSASEEEGNAEVVARPKVITADKQQAQISSGIEFPYQERVAGVDGGTTTSFKEIKLQLDVTPQITPDDRIIMELDINQDTLGAVTDSGPAVNTNKVTTKVLVDNGETIVLGGVYQTTQTESVKKTPVLGDIPFMGSLFRRSTKDTNKQELLIFITPRLLRDSFTDR